VAEKIEIELVFTPRARCASRPGAEGQDLREETEALERALGSVKQREKDLRVLQQPVTTKGTTRQGR